LGIGDHYQQDSEEVRNQHDIKHLTDEISRSESSFASGVDAPPTPRSSNSDFDHNNKSEKARTYQTHLLTLNTHTLSQKKPLFNSFLKTCEANKSNYMLDKEIGLEQSPFY